MLIALDYDNTFTADVVFWRNFIHSCLLHNHQVVMVSARNNVRYNYEEIEGAVGLPLPVYLTSAEPKKKYLEDMATKVDVWIDDSPESIVNFEEYI